MFITSLQTWTRFETATLSQLPAIKTLWAISGSISTMILLIPKFQARHNPLYTSQSSAPSTWHIPIFPTNPKHQFTRESRIILPPPVIQADPLVDLGKASFPCSSLFCPLSWVFSYYAIKYNIMRLLKKIKKTPFWSLCFYWK